MKIHLTESTKVLLDEIGGFIMEERGVLEIKVLHNICLNNVASYNSYKYEAGMQCFLSV